VASTAPKLDLYAPLSHKEVLGTTGGHTANLLPSWVPEDDQRRLAAYKVLKALEANAARHFLPASTSESVRSARREYGDAALLAAAVRAGVLGDSPELVVDGADVELPDEPDLPPEPTVPDSGDGPAAAAIRRVAEARRARWAGDVEEAVTEWERQWAELPGLQERQRWLRDWADDEGLWGKVHEAEGDAVALGDGVLTLAWSAAKQRPVLRVYDPGFYFPVIDERAADEGFPRKVHLAWAFERTDRDGRRREFVRRLTWELVELDEPRQYPWGDGPSTAACVFSDGTWSTSDLSGIHGLSDLSDSAATWAATEDGVEARRLDLGLDFIPVIHIPNTPASREHFGSSALLLVAQLLEDIHATDTDVQAAAALAAGPVIAMSGAKREETTRVQPGTVFHLPEGGRMDVLDLAEGLKALQDLAAGRRDLLSVNARVPGAALGRIDPGQAPSGVALALLFSPFGQLVGELRLSRDAKYSLLFKFAARLAQAGQVLDPGPNPTARIAFGPFLPTDRSALVNEVARLLEAGAISTQTAVRSLVAGGFSVEDARGEVDRIRLDNPAKARDLADAVGSEQAAADYLGLDVTANTVAAPATGAPNITLGGEGGQ
jgi:hypothetical protein